MAGTPIWKLYIDHEYVAAFKEPLHAGVLMGVLGKGQLRYDHHTVVWTEGVDGDSSGSYEACVEAAERIGRGGRAC